jgi:hypothetical protein
MAKILVHLTHGPEHPTRAALAFLVAKSAIDEGHILFRSFLQEMQFKLFVRLSLITWQGLVQANYVNIMTLSLQEVDISIYRECLAKGAV